MLNEIRQIKKDKFLQDLTYTQNLKTKKKKEKNAKQNITKEDS